MKIGIIGTGRMGQKLAAVWAKNGHAVCLGSREHSKAHSIAAQIGNGVTGKTIQEAAEASEALLFAFPWYAFIDIMRAIDSKLQGKTIIDCINPINSSGSLALGHKWSAGEEIANQYPLAHVVKAFNTIYYDHLDQPQFSGQTADLFYCSNSDQAKRVVVQLAAEMGFNPVDAGPIKHARYLEPMAAFWMQMAFHIGLGPEYTLKLLPRG